MLSDSTIVLAQINSLPWLYKPWVSGKLAEIRETLPTDGAEKIVTFKHVTSEHNIANIHTRLCFDEPSSIPWLSSDDMEIDESFHKKPEEMKPPMTLDLKKEETLLESTQRRTETIMMKPITLQKLVSVQLPLEKMNPEVLPKHEAFEIVDELLKKHNFKTTVSILTTLLMFNKKFQLNSARSRAQELIISVYQTEMKDWVNSFGGNIFFKIPPTNDGEPVWLQARE